MTSWHWVLVSCFSLFLPVSLSAELIHQPVELLQNQYGRKARIEKLNVLLTDDDAALVSGAGVSPFKERIFTFFVAKDQNKKILGYAGLLARKIRTKDQAALYFLSEKGELLSIELVAFYEPPEYQPTVKWLDQFKGAKVGQPIRVRHEVRVVTGATMTATSFVESANLVQAVWSQKIKGHM